MTFPILPSNSATGGYQTQRSLRCNSADSTYLNRTFSTPTNNRVWTYSCWIKLSRSGTAADQFRFLDAGFNNFDRSFLGMNATGGFGFSEAISGAYQAANTVAVFRDLSAWYHVVFSIDTTQAVDTNRVKIYINGVNQSTTTNVSQNLSPRMNSAVVHNISRDVGIPTAGFLNGYLTEVNFIDGQALDPSYFGQTNATTGQWEPKAYSGSYGTNGFYLNFKNNSTVSALGTDYSGNGNNWTPNNFSVTAGAGNDSLIDVPTNWDDGGNGRANYSTINPLDVGSGVVASNGNLDVSNAGGDKVAKTTIGFSSGKWYAEVTCSTYGSNYPTVGIVATDFNVNTLAYIGQTATSYGYGGIGTKLNNGSAVGYAASWTAGDIIGIAVDIDAGTITFYKNGVSQGVAYTGILAGTYCFACSMLSGTVFNWNFGQRPFAYTPPSGFKALNTQNLPSPTIAKGNTQFNPVLYTGNGSTQSVTGLAFTPDLVWIKSRSAATDHALYDVNRGVQSRLESNTTDAQVTSDGGLTAFNSGGFSLSTLAQVNTSAATYVAWNWKANGAGVTNTAGTITSTVSANTTAGFSVVTFTAPASGTFTVGHGLGVSPNLVIVKSRSSVNGWWVYYSGFSNPINDYLALNTTDAKQTYAAMWGSGMTSSVCGFSVFGSVQASANNVAYCFAAIPGYSAFGSYTGNGSADGPFVYTGLRPAYVMIKNASTPSGNWVIYDNKRGVYNLNGYKLGANLSSEENDPAQLGDTSLGIDFLSNGFKIRVTGSNHNNSGSTYIYAAFAESPFKYANAR